MSTKNSHNRYLSLASFDNVQETHSNCEENVFYSSEYSPSNSYEELFNLSRQQNGQKPMRERNFPHSFFTPPSASSSSSHSRDSSLDSSVNNIPKSLSACIDINNKTTNSMAGKIYGKSSKKAHDILSQFHVKTRSLPASFAPNKSDNTEHSLHNKVRLEPFSQLQRNLIEQNKLRFGAMLAEHLTTDTLPDHSTLNVVSNQVYDTSALQNHHQLLPTTVQSDLPSQSASLMNQSWVQVQLNPQVSLTTTPVVTIGQPVLQNFVSVPANNVISHNQISVQNTVQQLEKECENMKKRQLELQQTNLISTNRVTPLYQNSIPGQYRSLSSLYSTQEANSLLNSYEYQESQLVNSDVSHSRQESIDSGLDLACYSSSIESTSCNRHLNVMERNNSTHNSNNIINDILTYSGQGTLNKVIQPANMTTNNNIHTIHSMARKNASITAEIKVEPNNCLDDGNKMTSTEYGQNIQNSLAKSRPMTKVRQHKASLCPSILDNGTEFAAYNINDMLDGYESMSVQSSPRPENSTLIVDNSELALTQMSVGEDSFSEFSDLDQLFDPLVNFNLPNHNHDPQGFNYITF